MRKLVSKPRCITRAESSGNYSRWTIAEKRGVVSYVRELEVYIYGLEQQVLMDIFTRDTGLDLGAPPHDVPCPHCYAYALEPCRTIPRPGPSGPWSDKSLLTMPHAERISHRKARPEIAVKKVPSFVGDASLSGGLDPRGSADADRSPAASRVASLRGSHGGTSNPLEGVNLPFDPTYLAIHGDAKP